MKLLHIAALTLLATTAQAETICSKCEFTYHGRYLGMHWAGDRSTFQNRNIVADYARLGYGDGHGIDFDQYWVFDLTGNAAVSLTVDSKGTLLPAPNAAPLYGVEIYADTGSYCDQTRCTISTPDFSSPIVSKSVARRWSATTPSLAPGRYIIRVSGMTVLSGESAYSATMIAK